MNTTAVAVSECIGINAADLLENLEAHLQKLIGKNNATRPFTTSGLTPASFIEASGAICEKTRQSQPDGYSKFLDFIHSIRTTLNALATRLGSSLSERVYLTGLVDLFSLRPTAVLGGDFTVRMTTKDAENYLGLSASTCTNVRRALAARGLIIIEGDRVDLSPLVQAITPLINPFEADASGKQLSPANPKNYGAEPNFGCIPPTVISNVSKKKELTINRGDDLFGQQALKDTIALSPKLQTALDNYFGKSFVEVTTEQILQAMPAVTHDLLHDGSSFNYRQAWQVGEKQHGIRMVGFLIATLEGKPKAHMGKWFWSMVKRKTVDITSNLNALVVQREKSAEALAKSEIVQREKLAQEMRAGQHEQISKLCFEAFTEIKNKKMIDASDFVWVTALDRLQVQVSPSKVTIGVRLYNRKDDDNSLINIVNEILDRINDCDKAYSFGSFAGLKTISSFKFQ